MLEIGAEQRLRLAISFNRLINNAIQQISESSEAITKYKMELKMSEEELRDEGKKMKEFYVPEEVITTMYYDDEICEILDALDVLDIFVERATTEGYHILQNTPFKTIQELVAGLTNGRIKVTDTPSTLRTRLEVVLGLAGQKYSHWIDGNKQRTAHYLKCQAEKGLRELKIVKYEIYKLLLGRKLELEALHDSSAAAQGMNICI
jgi:predicted HTH domain antitoxin